jgi:hypothetical protein
MRPVSESLGRAQAESSSLRGLRHEVCGIFFLLGMLEHIVVTPVFGSNTPQVSPPREFVLMERPSL